MMNFEPGEWYCTDERPCSYMTGLFVALFVRAGRAGRKDANMVANVVARV